MELICSTDVTTYQIFDIVNFEKYKYYILQVCASMRPLNSTIITLDDVTYCTSVAKRVQCVYGGEPNNYEAQAYFSDDSKKVYIRSISIYDRAKLYGVL